MSSGGKKIKIKRREFAGRLELQAHSERALLTEGSKPDTGLKNPPPPKKSLRVILLILQAENPSASQNPKLKSIFRKLLAFKKIKALTFVPAVVSM